MSGTACLYMCSKSCVHACIVRPDLHVPGSEKGECYHFDCSNMIEYCAFPCQICSKGWPALAQTPAGTHDQWALIHNRCTCVCIYIYIYILLYICVCSTYSNELLSPFLPLSIPLSNLTPSTIRYGRVWLKKQHSHLTETPAFTGLQR